MRANEFYQKIDEWYSADIMKLFYEITEYFFSTIKMTNTDDVTYEAINTDHSLTMIITGVNDSVTINIHDNNVMYVSYGIRNSEMEAIYGGNRCATLDTPQWVINSGDCEITEYENTTNFVHSDSVQAIFQ